MTKKISELNNVVTPNLSDAFETAQSGAPDSRRITTSQIKDAIEPNLQLTPTQIDGTAITLLDTTDVLNQGANNWYLTEDGGTTDNLETMPTIVDIYSQLGDKVNKAGDTMTGLLLLSGDPASNLGAATKQYVDNEIAAAGPFVLRGGDTMTGLLVLSSDPSAALGAATKQYVDNSIADVDLQLAYDNSGSKQIEFDPGSGIAFKDSANDNVFIIQEDFVTSFRPTTISQNGSDGIIFLDPSTPSTLYEAKSTTKVAKPFNKMTNSQFAGVSGLDEAAMAWSTDYKLPILYNGEEVQTVLTGENVEVKGNLSKNFSNGVLTLTGLGGDTPDAAFSSVSKQDNIFLMNFLVVGTFYPIVLEQPLTEQHASDFENVFLTIGTTTTLLMRYLGDTTQAFVGGASFSIFGANPSVTTYKYRVQIRRANGVLESTNFGGSINLVNSVTVVSFEFGFTLNQNDGIYFTFANTQNFNALTIRDFTAEIMSVAGSIPSTDGLPEGANNFFLSTDGGESFQNLNGSAVVGNLPKFDTVGGGLIDSEISADNLMLLTGDQDIAGIKVFQDEIICKNPGSESATSISGSSIFAYTDLSQGFGITCTGLNTFGEYTYFSQTTFFTYDDETESSSSYRLSILDRGVLNRVLNVAGANDVEGCRVSFGGDDPRIINSFTINKPILHEAYEAALFEIVSTSQGVLLPRMTNAQMNDIDVSESPDGLLLYTADAPMGFKFWDTSWHILLSDANVTGDITFTNAGVGTIANNAVNLTTKVSGVLPFANGGLGPLTNLVTGDLIVATGTNTPGKIAGVATGQVLTSGGVGALPVYSSTPTVSGISLTSPTNISAILGTYGLTSASSATAVQKNQFLSLSGQTITADQTYSFGTTTVINSFVSTDLLLFTVRPGDSCGGVNDISFAFYNGEFVVLSNTPVVNDRYVTNVALNTIASSVVITRTTGCGGGQPSPLTVSVNGSNVEIVSSGTSGDYTILNNSKYTSISLKNSGAFGGILASGLGGTPFNLNGILEYKIENSVNTLNARVPVNLGGRQTQAVTGALNIRGPNSSITTSANFYTASDQYPIMQILPFAHANAYLSFDAYYDGAWKSASAGSSFQIAKTSNALDFNYGVAAAGAALSLSNGFRLGSNGNVTIMSGDLLVNTASKTLTLKSGANGSTGSATFTDGSATISSTAAAANDLIDIMVTTSTNQGFYSVTVTPGSGYTVTSSNAADASAFKWKRTAVA